MDFRATWLTVAGLAMLSSLSAQAATTTYLINRQVGSEGRLTGTIVTDGTIGALQASSILDWNLTINADSDASTVGALLGPLSGNNSTWNSFPLSALSTVATGQTSTLLFDFGTAASQVSQIATLDYSVVWQMQAGIPFQDELLRESSLVPWEPVQTFHFHDAVSVALVS
jgi:hypothetical protein